MPPSWVLFVFTLISALICRGCVDRGKVRAKTRAEETAISRPTAVPLALRTMGAGFLSTKARETATLVIGSRSDAWRTVP